MAGTRRADRILAIKDHRSAKPPCLLEVGILSFCSFIFFKLSAQVGHLNFLNDVVETVDVRLRSVARPPTCPPSLLRHGHHVARPGGGAEKRPGPRAKESN
jgi:hypothetical protein